MVNSYGGFTNGEENTTSTSNGYEPVFKILKIPDLCGSDGVIVTEVVTEGVNEVVTVGVMEGVTKGDCKTKKYSNSTYKHNMFR
jgi:hypothetical protein